MANNPQGADSPFDPFALSSVNGVLGLKLYYQRENRPQQYKTKVPLLMCLAFFTLYRLRINL
jgi:hypothetical protein